VGDGLTSKQCDEPFHRSRWLQKAFGAFCQIAWECLPVDTVG
jgi:hypothetical protein